MPTSSIQFGCGHATETVTRRTHVTGPNAAKPCGERSGQLRQTTTAILTAVVLTVAPMAVRAELVAPLDYGARGSLSDDSAQPQTPPAPAPVAANPTNSQRLSDCAGDCSNAGGCCVPTAGCDGSCGAGGSCLGGGLFGGCQLGDPWTLPQIGLLERMKIRTGGWIQQGITFNAERPHDSFNGPVATNDLDSEYQLNQLWLYLDRKADNGGSGFAWGGHVDMMYGTDWRFGINNGLEDRINGFNRQTYGIVIPQAYVELALNRLSIKLGHFAGILDYEAVPAPMNPFYSHSYSYGYTVPQLVTGALADYKLTKQLSVQAGFHRGWMQFEDNNSQLDFMGGVRWHSQQDRVSLAYGLSTGPQDPAGNQERFVSSFVAQAKVTPKFKYVLVQNYGTENGAQRNGQDGEWYGVNQYFLYTINPCWTAGMRFEWMRDDDGVRIAGPGNIPGVRAFSGRGFAGNFYALTAGVNWRPHANVLFRPEVRWDWYDGQAGPTGLPFDDGNSDDQLTFAMDMIVTY